MDRKLMKLVVAMALFGDAKVSIIKLKHNQVYRNPEFVPIESTDRFGIKSDSEEQGGGMDHDNFLFGRRLYVLAAKHNGMQSKRKIANDCILFFYALQTL